MEPTPKVGYCPHCGNRTILRLEHTYRFSADKLAADNGRGDHNSCPSVYYLAVCETCKEILLYFDEFDDIGNKNFDKASLIWPDPRELHYSVPEQVRVCYAEANRIRLFAPNAFAGQIRRALEAVCDDTGAQGGNLHDKLERLADMRKIPPSMVEMAGILREQGNEGVHTYSTGVNPGNVQTIDDFFRVVVEYVYVNPHKLQKFKDQLDTLPKEKREHE